MFCCIGCLFQFMHDFFYFNQMFYLPHPFYLLKVWNMICPQKEQITTNKLKTWNVKVTD